MLGVFSALAYVSMAFGRIPMISFLKYDPQDIVIVLAGYIFGPLSSVLVSVVVSFVEMVTVSDSGIIGFAMNVLSTCAFACPAVWVYRRFRHGYSAAIGLASGCLLATCVMLLWNYVVTPIYMNVSRDVVVGMLSTVFLPFNLIKGGLNAGLTLLLHKPVLRALRGAHLIPEVSDADEAARAKTGQLALAVLVTATCVGFFLAYHGII